MAKWVTALDLRTALKSLRFPKVRSRAVASLSLSLGVATASIYSTYSQSQGEPEPDANSPVVNSKKKLKVFTREEVSKHRTKETGIWVTYQGRVYDVTTFVDGHPGGSRIMMAAGAAIDPFWAMDSVHHKQHVKQILAKYLIGELSSADVAAVSVGGKSDDPYRNDPERHLALLVQSTKPFCAEVPKDILSHFVTPNDLWFVRSHHPVPKINPDEYRLEIRTDDRNGDNAAASSKTLAVVTLEDLKTKLPRHSVTCTLQCAGNRRSEFNQFETTLGNAFQCGAISTATFTGVRLRDVLKYCGVVVDEEKRDPSFKHIQFAGYDSPYDASIPVGKGLSLDGEVLVAFEMNGTDIPPDHGYPVRVIVPGHLGARSVKWLKSITVSSSEASGIWQQGYPYKMLPPNVKSFDRTDVGPLPASQEMPVTSAILEPPNGETCEEGEHVDLKGYAYSGGGRGIIRVEVTADGGKSWVNASLTEGPSLDAISQGKAWTWSQWQASVPIKPEHISRDGRFTVCSKATDSALNTQPPSPHLIWNLRGIYNNAWSCVSLKIPSPTKK